MLVTVCFSSNIRETFKFVMIKTGSSHVSALQFGRKKKETVWS